MIRLFFIADHHLISLLTAADDAVGDVKDVDLYTLDIGRREVLARA